MKDEKTEATPVVKLPETVTNQRLLEKLEQLEKRLMQIQNKLEKPLIS